jgi:N-acetylneuraminic acid mutarotase
MPDQPALREALHGLVADVHADAALRRRIDRRPRRPLLLAAAAVLVVALVGAALVAVRDRDDSSPVVTTPGGGWAPLAPAPFGPLGDSAVAWTGRELLVWSGAYGERVTQDAGFAYDPSADHWRTLPPAPIPGRLAMVSAWTGHELIVWGGTNGTVHTIGGGAYDPEHDTWRTIAEAPIAPRANAVGVWTGSEVVVWGGGSPEEAAPTDGAAYDPATNTWRRIPAAPIEGQGDVFGAWTGSAVLVHSSSGTALYDPAADRWTPIAPTPLGDHRVGTVAAWVDGRLVVWGGYLVVDGGAVAGSWQTSGAVYDPTSGAWTPMSAPPPSDVEPPNLGPLAAVVGDAVAIWPDSLVYRPDSDTWDELPEAPVDRARPAVIAGFDGRLHVWAIGPQPGVFGNDVEALAAQRAPGAAIGIAEGPPAERPVGNAACSYAVDGLRPTYLPTAAWGFDPVPGDGGGLRWEGGEGQSIQLLGREPWPLSGRTTPLHVLGQPARLGTIHEGVGVTTACGFELAAYGVSREVVQRFAEGLLPAEQALGVWPDRFPAESAVRLEITDPWRVDAEETALQYASQVLGYAAPEVELHDGDAVTVRDGDRRAVVMLARNVGGRWWSVTSAFTYPLTLVQDAEWRLTADQAEVTFHSDLPCISVDVSLGRGDVPGDSVGQDWSPGGARVVFTGAGDVSKPGWIVVHCNHGDGSPGDWWATTIPPGPYVT